MTSQDQILVEVVDERGRVLGTAEKLSVHRVPGTLHRAFSLFGFDADGRLLLQRRASSKYHSPLLLTNTACGHPLPGEDPADAVRRRVADELGAEVTDLASAGTVQYHVHDEASGLDEHEYNHVFVGRIDAGALRPNPEEVAEVVSVAPQELAELRRRETFTAWYDDVWGVAAPLAADRGYVAASQELAQ